MVLDTDKISRPETRNVEYKDVCKSKRRDGIVEEKLLCSRHTEANEKLNDQRSATRTEVVGTCRE